MEKENQNEFLSVKDFAEAAGVTVQAVYKRLHSKKLKPFVRTEDERTVISLEALEMFAKEPEKEVNNSTTTVEQQLIEMLQTELKEKNEQIKKLQTLLDQEQHLCLTYQKQLMPAQDEKQSEEVVTVSQESPKRPWFYKIFGR